MGRDVAGKRIRGSSIVDSEPHNLSVIVVARSSPAGYMYPAVVCKTREVADAYVSDLLKTSPYTLASVFELTEVSYLVE